MTLIFLRTAYWVLVILCAIAYSLDAEPKRTKTIRTWKEGEGKLYSYVDRDVIKSVISKEHRRFFKINH